MSHASGAGRRGPASERVGEFEGRSPSSKNGAPAATRTRDPRLRRPVLYPTELRAHANILTSADAPRLFGQFIHAEFYL